MIEKHFSKPILYQKVGECLRLWLASPTTCPAFCRHVSLCLTPEDEILHPTAQQAARGQGQPQGTPRAAQSHTFLYLRKSGLGLPLLFFHTPQ